MFYVRRFNPYLITRFPWISNDNAVTLLPKKNKDLEYDRNPENPVRMKYAFFPLFLFNHDIYDFHNVAHVSYIDMNYLTF